MIAFASWSGGKDSCLALYKALKGGFDVEVLLNTITEDGMYSRSHGVRAEVLKKQAETIGLNIIQIKTSWEDYEANYKQVLSKLKEEGFSYGVFGDIDLEVHREWVEKVCASAGIKPVLPLWKMEREKVVREFIGSGFRAVVCSVREGILEKEWLGKEINEEFIEEMKKRGVDACGENGEFHTFVYDGPIFKKPLKLKFGEIKTRKKYYFIDIEVQ
ncbi:MAG: diphthine--ammonia ligase [Archaeoglobaceae archaeon]|nr:diphthine--ammonia ligase [Archaeoglobaceae archaeon]MDW8117960.1 diphthine--ammonia ligase [Archaeoglobaceae archaeon]